MFSRNALSSKYKSYIKTLQTCKDNLRNPEALKVHKRCEEIIQSINKLECKQCIKSILNHKNLLETKYVQRYKKLACSVHSAISVKRRQNKDNESSLEHDSVQKKLDKILSFTPALSAMTASVVNRMIVSETSEITEPVPEAPPIEEPVETANQPNSHGISFALLSDIKYLRKYIKVLQDVKSVSMKYAKHIDSKSFFENVALQKKLQRLALSLSAVAVHVVDKTPSTDAAIVMEPIPEPPLIPEVSAEVVNQLNHLGEATFASLGLGGWSPMGIVQTSFEYLHVTLGIPWWEAIIIGTIIIRLCMFPLVIIAQRNAAKMNNYMPQLQVLQVKMSEARKCGNQLEVARYSQELMLFMKEKNLNPFKNMIVPLAQMPVFISFFMGLREMANVPVESLRTGGLFWFQDLTVPDQYFALPIITSLTLWATIELGTDSARLSSQNLQTMKYVLRALPLFIIPFTVNFPGAILCYWVSTNFISLLQVGFLRIPAVREYFRIEALVKHNPDNLPVKNKGFVGGIKESWTNLKISKELEERRRLDELQFQRAGKGPLVRTYKYDPTKQVSKDPNAVSAKER